MMIKSTGAVREVIDTTGDWYILYGNEDGMRPAVHKTMCRVIDEIELWVARDRAGGLCLFNGYPTWNDGFGWWECGDNDDHVVIDDKLFPGLKSSDPPIQVELIEKGEL